jgi:hypothetical protein
VVDGFDETGGGGVEVATGGLEDVGGGVVAGVVIGLVGEAEVPGEALVLEVAPVPLVLGGDVVVVGLGLLHAATGRRMRQAPRQYESRRSFISASQTGSTAGQSAFMACPCSIRIKHSG